MPRQRRERLHQKNPHCHYCGIKTVILDGNNNVALHNLATIDHVYSKYDPRRYKVSKSEKQPVVLSCWKCNNERSAFEERQLSASERLGRSLGLRSKGPIANWKPVRFVPSRIFA